MPKRKRSTKALVDLDEDAISALGRAAAAAAPGELRLSAAKEAVPGLTKSQLSEFHAILSGLGMSLSQSVLEKTLDSLRGEYKRKIDGSDEHSFFLSTDLLARKWWESEATVISVTAPMGTQMRVEGDAKAPGKTNVHLSTSRENKIDVFLLRSEEEHKQ